MNGAYQASETTILESNDSNSCPPTLAPTTSGAPSSRASVAPSDLPSVAPTVAPSSRPSVALSDLPSVATTPTPCSGVTIYVEVKTDRYPGDTAWELRDDCRNGAVVLARNVYTQRNTFDSTECV